MPSWQRNVIALKLDRLFRNAADALTLTRQWDKTGIALHLVDVGGQAINLAGTRAPTSNSPDEQTRIADHENGHRLRQGVHNGTG